MLICPGIQFYQSVKRSNLICFSCIPFQIYRSRALLGTDAALSSHYCFATPLPPLSASRKLGAWPYINIGCQDAGHALGMEWLASMLPPPPTMPPWVPQLASQVSQPCVKFSSLNKALTVGHILQLYSVNSVIQRGPPILPMMQACEKYRLTKVSRGLVHRSNAIISFLFSSRLLIFTAIKMKRQCEKTSDMFLGNSLQICLKILLHAFRGELTYLSFMFHLDLYFILLTTITWRVWISIRLLLIKIR